MEGSDIVYACLYDTLDKKTWAEVGDRSTLKSTLEALLNGLHNLTQPRVAYNHAPYAYYVLRDSSYEALFYVAIGQITMESRYGFRFVEEFEKESNMAGGDRDVLRAALDRLLLQYRDTAQQQDIVIKIQDQLDSTQIEMRQNLQQMYDRGAALDTLETEVLTLDENIQNIRATASAVKTTVWWKRVKFKVFMCTCCIIIILIVLIVLFVALAMAMKWI
jgi:hypothetical protein